VILASTREELKEVLTDAGDRGLSLGLVPTMGFLHEGHLSLVELARYRCDLLAVSVFVNPLQFGPGEDLQQYPRDLQRDLDLLRERGTDLVFAPPVDVMYPAGEPRVTVDPGAAAQRLCGAYRPGHFRGVLTVVARLFGMFRPRVACFGQKDFQQAVLVRRMVEDLELGVEILLGPVVREPDGLAMSSRNVFLSPGERRDAAGLFRGLTAAQEAFRTGVRSGEALERAVVDVVGSHPLLRLQYAELVEAESLARLETAVPGSVLAVAAHCGSTRLIDNQRLHP